MAEAISGKPHHLPRNAYIGRLHISFTLCIADGVPIFKNGAIVEKFTAFLSRAAERNRCQVPVYCLMPEHIHIVIAGIDEDSDLWAALVHFKQITGCWFSQHTKVHWQKNFYDHVIRKSEDLKNQIYYIVNNPVRRGLVQNWDDYAYTGSIGVDLRDVLGEIKDY